MAAFKNKDNGTWYVQFRYHQYQALMLRQIVDI